MMEQRTGPTGGLPEVDVTVPADDGTPLAGTLTLPASPGPHPAVVCLPGSGRLDRDSNAGRVRMELGRPIALALAGQGIAALRYDRRGVGASPGNWRTVGFLDNRADAAAALRALRARPEIRADAVGVVGHSEGAEHAIWLGAHAAPAAVVLLAGYARTGRAALAWQADSVAASLPRALRPLVSLLIRRTLRKIAAGSTDVARVGGMPVNARWWRELLDYDPRVDLLGIRVPLLAVTGDKDLQVDPADLATIAALVPGAETRLVPNLTHLLRRDTRAASLRSYRGLLREPVDAALLDEVARWLGRRLC